MARRLVNLASDNAGRAAPEVMAALAEAAAEPDMPYGDDRWTARLGALAAEVFEREVAIFPVATGTAANALALATVIPPWGVAFCHEAAHIEEDECAAPEFYAGGAKLALLGGAGAKFSAAGLRDQLAAASPAPPVHRAQPAAVSLTQATEAGAVYRPEEVAGIAAVCREHGLALHMDGARLANAVAALGCAPADVTWRAGVDILSLGATKNGALAAEAVVFFDPARAGDFEFRRKRGGHLFSKMRFMSAQLVASLEDGALARLGRPRQRHGGGAGRRPVGTAGRRGRAPGRGEHDFPGNAGGPRGGAGRGRLRLLHLGRARRPGLGAHGGGLRHDGRGRGACARGGAGRRRGRVSRAPRPERAGAGAERGPRQQRRQRTTSKISSQSPSSAQ